MSCEQNRPCIGPGATIIFAAWWPAVLHVKHVSHRNRNPSQPLRPVTLPVHAFQLVSADLFLFYGVNYVLVVDAYSKYIVIVYIVIRHR